MSSCRRQHRLSAWIALVAMLALALLPTLSHALAAVRGDATPSWAEICSADGTRRTGAPAEAPLKALDHAGEHCPFCAHGTDLAPPAAQAQLVAVPAALALPPLYWHAPAPAFAWRAAAPRGPPTLTA